MEISEFTGLLKVHWPTATETEDETSVKYATPDGTFKGGIGKNVIARMDTVAATAYLQDMKDKYDAANPG